MRYTYTAVITPGEGKCYARVPDIAGCVTTGQDIEDAVRQITDALCGCLAVRENEGIPIPPATPQPETPHAALDILALIHVDTALAPPPR